MKIQTWIKPLVASLGTLMMCALLTACQSSNANVNEGYDNKAHSGIQIRNHGKHQDKTFYVDGTRYEWSDLNKEQQSKIMKLEQELDLLASNLDIDEEEMEQWAKKIEAAAASIEVNVEGLEDITIEFDKDTISLTDIEKISNELVEKTGHIEVNMRGFEEKMRELEVKMPHIDESKIRAIEAKAKELEKVLTEIVTTL